MWLRNKKNNKKNKKKIGEYLFTDIHSPFKSSAWSTDLTGWDLEERY